jgi:preprotein translocase subunit SecG
MNSLKQSFDDLIYLTSGGNFGSGSSTNHLLATFTILIIVIIFIMSFGLGFGLRRNMDSGFLINPTVSDNQGSSALLASKTATPATGFIGGMQGFRGMRNLAGSPAASGLINGASSSVRPSTLLTLAQGN